MKFVIRKLVGTLALFCVLMMNVSCEKVEHCFFFSKAGGPFDFEMELDGSSLMVSDDMGSVKNAVFYGNESDMEHSNWVVDLDWIRVYYMPTEQHVYVGVSENESGKVRTARVSAEKKGKRIVIAEFKQRYAE